MTKAIHWNILNIVLSLILLMSSFIIPAEAKERFSKKEKVIAGAAAGALVAGIIGYQIGKHRYKN